MKPKYEPPYIKCSDHQKRLGYIVCTHVLDGSRPIAVFDRARPKVKGVTGTGTILCEICATDSATIDNLKSTCERCCAERGLLPQ